jgi:enamine deaminase RidA (YjgF/YER057c/UK114 family)
MAGAFQRETFNPPGVFAHPGYSRVCTVSGPAKMIFIAGQTPTDDEYRCVAPGDMRGQFLKVMENLGIQLSAAGASWDDVTYRRIFTLDVDALVAVAMDPSIPTYFSNQPPSTLIGVTRLSDPEFLLEIEVWAAVAEDV